MEDEQMFVNNSTYLRNSARMIFLDFFAFKWCLFFISKLIKVIVLNTVWYSLVEFKFLYGRLFKKVIKALDDKLLVDVAAICSRLFRVIIDDQTFHTSEAFDQTLEKRLLEGNADQQKGD